jgi:hypothetical protein
MRRSRRTFGFAVVALVLVIAFMFVLMTAGTGDSVNLGLRNASRGTMERRTNYGAYGAMQLGLDELNKLSSYSCDVQGVTVPGDPELVYSLRICNNWDNALSPNPPTGVSSRVPDKMVYLEARCDLRDYVGQYTTRVYSKAAVGDFRSRSTIVGTDQITITNSTVDAYYVDGTSNLLRPWNRGVIQTNSVQPGGITLAGPSTFIKSSMIWGPKGLPTVIVNPGPPQVTWTSDPPGNAIEAEFTHRVPRFRPPRNPITALSSAGVVAHYTAPSPPLDAADFKSLSASGTTLTLRPGEFFVAGNLTLLDSELVLSGVDAEHPCDIYVGGNVTIDNSRVNWANRLGQADPANYPNLLVAPAPGALDVGQLALQAVLGPRTLRIFFVGSGAPRYKDCTFIARNNSKISLVAAGKAMKVELLSGTEAWGGFKGARVLMNNSMLHYHKVND